MSSFHFVCVEVLNIAPTDLAHLKKNQNQKKLLKQKQQRGQEGRQIIFGSLGSETCSEEFLYDVPWQVVVAEEALTAWRAK